MSTNADIIGYLRTGQKQSQCNYSYNCVALIAMMYKILNVFKSKMDVELLCITFPWRATCSCGMQEMVVKDVIVAIYSGFIISSFEVVQ